MLSQAEKAYCQALTALKNGEYKSAADLFEQAAAGFTDDKEFALLRETTRLLVDVKDRLAEHGDNKLEIEENS